MKCFRCGLEFDRGREFYGHLVGVHHVHHAKAYYEVGHELAAKDFAFRRAKRKGPRLSPVEASAVRYFRRKRREDGHLG